MKYRHAVDAVSSTEWMLPSIQYAGLSLAAPVALFHGTRDLNVDVRHARAMEKALKGAGKPVIYREYEDLQHGLEDTTARVDMLTTIGAFLDELVKGTSAHGTYMNVRDPRRCAQNRLESCFGAVLKWVAKKAR